MGATIFVLAVAIIAFGVTFPFISQERGSSIGMIILVMIAIGLVHFG